MFVEQVNTDMDDLLSRLTVDMDRFFKFNGTIVGYWDLFFGPLITSWWLRGRQEHPRGQLGLQGWIFFRLLVDLGNLLGVVFYQFACFFSGLR